jgi:hypothetical protein
VIEETTTLKAIAVNADGEESSVATARYVIGAVSDVKNFKRVASTDDLVSGMRYIIACGSKKMAAGQLSGDFLANVEVSLSSDIITIGEHYELLLILVDERRYGLRRCDLFRLPGAEDEGAGLSEDEGTIGFDPDELDTDATRVM